MKPFYGWRVAAALLVVLAFSSGLGFYCISVFMAALAEQRGFTISLVSGATTLFFIISGFAGMGVANLMQKHDPRLIICGGAIAGGFGMICVGQATEVWQMYAAYIVFGTAFAGCSLVPATTLVTRWFIRQRAMALAVTTTGLSLGGVVLTPLAAFLVSNLGLAEATVWLAIFYMLGIVPISLLFVRGAPEDMGLLPDGVKHEDSEPPTQTQLGVTYEIAVRSKFFIAFSIAYLLLMMAQVGCIAHMYSLVNSRADDTLAAIAVSVSAGASMCGRLIGGWLLGFVSMRQFAFVIMLSQPVTLFWFSFAESEFMLIAAAIAFGLTMGNLLMLQPLLLSEAVGIRDYSRIFALNQFISTFGVALGPALVGILHDLLHGYQAAFISIGGVALLGIVIFQYAGKPNFFGEEAPAPVK
ncbi:MAG: MFS transporter [Pseudomonadota bacterium]